MTFAQTPYKLEFWDDYFMISELTLNVDAYTKSACYFKDRDQKLKAGPLWDYNFALGGVGAQNAAPQSASDTGGDTTVTETSTTGIRCS